MRRNVAIYPIFGLKTQQDSAKHRGEHRAGEPCRAVGLRAWGRVAAVDVRCREQRAVAERHGFGGGADVPGPARGDHGQRELARDLGMSVIALYI